jgi:hypothetical protein
METLAREAELVVWFADHTETLAGRLTVGFLLAFSPLLSQRLKSLWSLDRDCTLICPGRISISKFIHHSSASYIHS